MSDRVPYLHHDDNQSCNLRAARSEQDGFWQKTWKIALSSALPSSPFRHSVRFRYRPSNSGSGSSWASPSFIAASPISRAPSSLTLRFDITSAIDGQRPLPLRRMSRRDSAVARWCVILAGGCRTARRGWGYNRGLDRGRCWRLRDDRDHGCGFAVGGGRPSLGCSWSPPPALTSGEFEQPICGLRDALAAGWLAATAIGCRWLKYTPRCCNWTAMRRFNAEP